MDDAPEQELELVTITQLRQVAGPGLQPYRLHLQVDSCLEKQTSQGNPFLEVKLADGGDSLLWRIFDNNPCFMQARELPRGAFVEISAQWIDAGKYGIEPRQARIRRLSEEERQTLLNGSSDLAARQHEDYQTILSCVEAIEDPRLKTLSGLFLEKFGDRFKRTAAGGGKHHPRRGGLVEHVAQMMRCAAAICGVYPALNRDLMIAGVLFHDCGKLWENSYPESGFNMPYNINGEMLGHISLGLELVNRLWREMLERPEVADWATLEPAPELVRLHLLHLIAAHHGQYEFGSPVLPKTPEAIALHHVDNIDAKMEMFRRGYAASKEIGPGIFERFRPWPVNVVAPLAAYQPPPEVMQEEEIREAAGSSTLSESEAS